MKESRRYEGNDVRRVLAGMVTDATVLTRIASQWKDGGLFDSKWANLVGGWCVKHLRKYDSPPNGQLQRIYETWASNREVDEEVASGVGKFLSYVSDEWASSEKPTSDYLVDVAGEYLNRVKARKVHEDVGEMLEANRVGEAVQLMANIGRVELGAGSMIDPLKDTDVWQQAFDPERRKPLVTYRQGLGKFFGDSLSRGSLIAFMGPDKSGKSWWLMDVAYRSLRNRYRVAYFEVGDLLQDEVLLRLGQRVTRRPLWAKDVMFPTKISWNDEGKVMITSTKIDFKEDLGWTEVYRELKKFTRNRSLLRLSCHPIGSIDAAGIGSLLRDWAREGWVADVVIIDYADILAAPSGLRETNDQIDETWKRLRRISQEQHCLVMTATQSSSLAYSDSKANTLRRKHFSGRKTKLAHVNGMVGINVADDDKQNGVMRLNWVVRRSAGFSEDNVVVVAGNLEVGCPDMVSTY
jgi:hypothetical protein